MNIFQRVLDSFSFNDSFDDAEYDYEYGDEAYMQEPTVQDPAMMSRDRATPQTATPNAASMNNVVGMPNRANGISEVVVLQPRSFEEIPQAVRLLRERKSVILNMMLMDPDQAQRSVDFVAGGVFAIDGHQERLGENIFLFTPNVVQITAQSSAQSVFNPPITPPQPSMPQSPSMSTISPTITPLDPQFRIQQ